MGRASYKIVYEGCVNLPEDPCSRAYHAVRGLCSQDQGPSSILSNMLRHSFGPEVYRPGRLGVRNGRRKSNENS